MVSMAQIQTYADEVARRFKPEKLILFGSYAYGRPTADSDVDLLVVIAHDPRCGRKSVEIRQAVRAAFPLDLIVRHPRVVRQRLKRGDGFLEEVTSKGRVLFES